MSSTADKLCDVIDNLANNLRYLAARLKNEELRGISLRYNTQLAREALITALELSPNDSGDFTDSFVKRLRELQRR